ncbi:DgyrCDS1968 [Dimorphilus gyrociliatus]|uniref:Nuclear cap-binding protein subunit 1 n=1 Tax=Dimorphilus gyrociliatus TaxID=2664684 RepID=A0A7I8VA79_9ANNE|nr:DgyrCDS1968 [Dimorphilus gyrociliatus]
MSNTSKCFSNPLYDVDKDPIVEFEVLEETLSIQSFTTRLPKSVCRRKSMIAVIFISCLISALLVAIAIGIFFGVKHNPSDTTSSLIIFSKVNGIVSIENGKYSSFKEAYKNNRSKEFQTLSTDFSKEMEIVLKSSDFKYLYNSLSINSVNEGSIIIDFTMYFNDWLLLHSHKSYPKVLSLDALKETLKNKVYGSFNMIDHFDLSLLQQIKLDPQQFKKFTKRPELPTTSTIKPVKTTTILTTTKKSTTSMTTEKITTLKTTKQATESQKTIPMVTTPLTTYISTSISSSMSTKRLSTKIASSTENPTTVGTVQSSTRVTDFQCASYEYLCKSGLKYSSGYPCIDHFEVCDGYFDCKENEDEDGCTGCSDGGFRCENSTTTHHSGVCTFPNERCDGIADCIDKSDEFNCTLCPDSYFKCTTGTRIGGEVNCIRNIFRCDGLVDCQDGSDEKDCPNVCGPDEFKCTRGFKIATTNRCILKSNVCDKINHCSDRSDEKGCNYTCPENYLSCKNHNVHSRFLLLSSKPYCYPDYMKCNGILECMDGSDEYPCINCNHSSTFACKTGMSIDGHQCIESSKQCDHFNDCLDGSDEENCKYSCNDDKIVCPKGKLIWKDSTRYCIFKTSLCDNYRDCTNGSDEETCSHSSCTADHFNCTAGHSTHDRKCVNLRFRCNGRDDCSDGSDELNCPTICSNETFLCPNQTCIGFDKVCDNHPDCSGGEDEKFCDKPCAHDEFKCKKGLDVFSGHKCIPIGYTCDNVEDCSDGSDEFACKYTCPSSQFKCRNGTTKSWPHRGVCISRAQHCNSVIDCTDGSDEENCNMCPSFLWQCVNGTDISLLTPPNFQHCIFKSFRCDRIRDCSDGSDEQNCTYSCKKENQFLCKTGLIIDYPYTEYCIDENKYCDGRTDCKDNSDEKYCSQTCKNDTIACQVGKSKTLGTHCIPKNLWCDRVKDCDDGSDEKNCNYTCPANSVACKTGNLIAGTGREYCYPAHNKCNEIPLCRDKSDQHGCYSNCAEDEMRCNVTNEHGTIYSRCLSLKVRCDKYNDCVDGADEFKCNYHCKDKTYFQCENSLVSKPPRIGYCINSSLKCNGIEDCLDGSDERNCNNTCSSRQLSCGSQLSYNSKSCYLEIVKCDRYNDCINGEDEKNCTYSCSVGYKLCKTGFVFSPPHPSASNYHPSLMYCIPNQQICDGKSNCQDHSDEENCDDYCNKPHSFKCVNETKCINQLERCDGKNDCIDGSDEVNCTCDKDSYKCSKGFSHTFNTQSHKHYCYKKIFKCDNYVDCSDGSDESDCIPGLPAKCYNDTTQFICGSYPTPGPVCLTKQQLCDRRFNCLHTALDEKVCSHKCLGNTFACDGKDPKNYKCIPFVKRCDGQNDCIDGTDELYCGKYLRPKNISTICNRIILNAELLKTELQSSGDILELSGIAHCRLPLDIFRKMPRKRRASSDDEEDNQSPRGRMRSETMDTQEMEERLENLILKIGEKSTSSLESNLDALAKVLHSDMSEYKEKILSIIADCVVDMPEKITVYSTLVGLINADAYTVGGEIVELLIRKLKDYMIKYLWEDARCIVRFLSDLVNCHVLSAASILTLFNSWLEVAAEDGSPQVRRDTFVYAVLSSLPWVGRALYEKKENELQRLLSVIRVYLKDRSKVHVKILQVWSTDDPHTQEDYLDSLWAQIEQLERNKWMERCIIRPYESFDSILCEALQHTLPQVTPPPHEESSQYPLPRVVYRMFDYTDVPTEGPVLPGAHAVERYVVEEQLHYIINVLHLDKKACAAALLNFSSRSRIPLNYMIVEVVFGQLFLLPCNPYIELFYNTLLIELCKLQPSSMPQVLAQATEMLFDRIDTMQTSCIVRFVNWFSHHLSNFQFRWSWDDWSEVATYDDNDRPKAKFVKEVLRKCMRLSYHQRVVDFTPDTLESLRPAKPTPHYKYDGHPVAQKVTEAIKSKATPEMILDILQEVANPLDNGGSDKMPYNPKKIDILVSTLLNLGSKSLSHSLAALAKFHEALRVLAGSEDAQVSVLHSVHDIWSQHEQMVCVLIDKLLKTQIVDCAAVASWVFSEQMRSEFTCFYVWCILHSAIKRMGQHVAMLQRQFEQGKEKRDAADRRGGIETDDTPSKSQLDLLEEKLDMAKADHKNLFLVIFQRFIIVLGEHLSRAETDNTEFETPWYKWVIDRLQEMFLLHHQIIQKYSHTLQTLVFTSDIDQNILDIFNQFCSLRA